MFSPNLAIYLADFDPQEQSHSFAGVTFKYYFQVDANFFQRHAFQGFTIYLLAIILFSIRSGFPDLACADVLMHGRYQ